MWEFLSFILLLPCQLSAKAEDYNPKDPESLFAIVSFVPNPPSFPPPLAPPLPLQLVQAKSEERYYMVVDEYKKRGKPPKCGFCSRSFQCRARNDTSSRRQCQLKEVREIHRSCDDSKPCDLSIANGGCPPPVFLAKGRLGQLQGLLQQGRFQDFASQFSDISGIDVMDTQKSRQERSYDYSQNFNWGDSNTNGKDSCSYGPQEYNERNLFGRGRDESEYRQSRRPFGGDEMVEGERFTLDAKSKGTPHLEKPGEKRSDERNRGRSFTPAPLRGRYSFGRGGDRPLEPNGHQRSTSLSPERRGGNGPFTPGRRRGNKPLAPGGRRGDGQFGTGRGRGGERFGPGGDDGAELFGSEWSRGEGRYKPFEPRGRGADGPFRYEGRRGDGPIGPGRGPFGETFGPGGDSGGELFRSERGPGEGRHEPFGPRGRGGDGTFGSGRGRREGRYELFEPRGQRGDGPFELGGGHGGNQYGLGGRDDEGPFEQRKRPSIAEKQQRSFRQVDEKSSRSRGASRLDEDIGTPARYRRSLIRESEAGNTVARQSAPSNTSASPFSPMFDGIMRRFRPKIQDRNRKRPAPPTEAMDMLADLMHGTTCVRWIIHGFSPKLYEI